MLRRRNQRHVSADESDEPVIGGSMIAIAMTDGMQTGGRKFSQCIFVVSCVDVSSLSTCGKLGAGRDSYC